MDPFVAGLGQKDHALFLDCRSCEYQLVSLPADVRLVVANTMVKHKLASGEYNVRREQCERGVELLSEHGVRSARALRDVTLAELDRFGRDLPEVILRRCRHVITENLRVTDAVQALATSDLADIGRLMAASHASLKDDYEVSCSELDLMVELAGKLEGCHGARMTGGGFGGCTVNLVEANLVDEFAAALSREYELTTGISPEIYVCRASDGASEMAGSALREPIDSAI